MLTHFLASQLTFHSLNFWLSINSVIANTQPPMYSCQLLTFKPHLSVSKPTTNGTIWISHFFFIIRQQTLSICLWISQDTWQWYALFILIEEMLVNILPSTDEQLSKNSFCTKEMKSMQLDSTEKSLSTSQITDQNMIELSHCMSPWMYALKPFRLRTNC